MPRKVLLQNEGVCDFLLDRLLEDDMPADYGKLDGSNFWSELNSFGGEIRISNATSTVGATITATHDSFGFGQYKLRFPAAGISSDKVYNLPTTAGTLSISIPGDPGNLSEWDSVGRVIDSSLASSDVSNLVDNISITQPVDLDAIETRVNELDASVVLMGAWDASSGSFPASTNAGESWIVSVGGTVDGVEFVANDRLVALVSGASTSDYADWHKLDYTDQVLSVAGRTGAVVLHVSDIDDIESADFDWMGDHVFKNEIALGDTSVAADYYHTIFKRFNQAAYFRWSRGVDNDAQIGVDLAENLQINFDLSDLGADLIFKSGSTLDEVMRITDDGNANIQGNVTAANGRLISTGDQTYAQWRCDNTSASGEEWVGGALDDGRFRLSGSGSGSVEFNVLFGGGFQFNDNTNTKAFDMDASGNCTFANRIQRSVHTTGVDYTTDGEGLIVATANVTITLSSADAVPGNTIVVAFEDTGGGVVDTEGAETISGSASVLHSVGGGTAYRTFTFISDGSNWFLSGNES